jgi:hypothetical protein
MLLTACASVEPVVSVPADLMRAACQPFPALMMPAEPLPLIREGQNMVETVADFSRRYRALARRDAALQAAVRECQK